MTPKRTEDLSRLVAELVQMLKPLEPALLKLERQRKRAAATGRPPVLIGPGIPANPPPWLEEHLRAERRGRAQQPPQAAKPARQSKPARKAAKGTKGRRKAARP